LGGFCFSGLRLLQRCVRVHADEGVEARIEPRDAAEQRLGEFDGGQLALCDRLCGIRCSHPGEIAHGRTTTIGGQGSSDGAGAPPDRRTRSVTFSAEPAAAAISSGNSLRAFSRPARRASASIVVSSIATLPFNY